MNETIASAYERWDAGDYDGFLALFPENAVFIVPGSTRVSGDHDKDSFRRVLEHISAATRAGRHKQQLVCSYEGTTGSVCVFDTFVTIDDTEEKYHSAHEWIFRNGSPHVWMLYVHEYDLFQRAWQ